MPVADSVPGGVNVRRWTGEPQLADLLGAYLLATEREKGSTVDSIDDLPPRYRFDPALLMATFGQKVALVAWRGADAAGCVVVTAPQSGASEIKRLWVDPDHRRCGIAAALVEEAVATARQLGADQARLTVLSWRTGAISLYERSGFEAVPSWDLREDLVCMERALS
jgi:putative acetyltransferase